MKGRKPQLAVIEGSAAPSGCPDAPVWLGKHAAEEWERVAPLLFRRRLLGDDTMGALEAYCVAVGVMRDCSAAPKSKAVDLFGQVADKQAQQRMRMMFQAMREARLLAAELGLTPHRRGANGQASNPDDEETDPPGDGWDSDLLA